MSDPHDKTPQHWKILSETQIATCRIFDVLCRHCHHPSGKDGMFYALKLADWALALPITTNRELILVQQYRFAANVLSWEVPGGCLNPHESPLEAAARELHEETGYSGQNPKLIGSCLPNPAILTNRAYFVLIENCSKNHSTQWDQHEELEVKLVPLDQAFKMAHSGKIQNGVTLNALFALKLHFDHPHPS